MKKVEHEKSAIQKKYNMKRVQHRWAFTCSNLTKETLEQGVKYDQS